MLRISATREMCTALKDHCVKINATLAKGQEDKEKLVRLNQERVAEYQVGTSCLHLSYPVLVELISLCSSAAARLCVRSMKSWKKTKSTGTSRITMLVCCSYFS